MTADDQFRAIVLAMLALFLPFGLYHRISAESGEKLDRWQEGAFILFGLRLGALPWFIGSVAWMINPAWMAWASHPMPSYGRWCGFLFIGIWGFLLVWTFRHLGKNLTDTVVTRQNHSLVTTGPYRFVRHPFYLAFFAAVIGTGLVAANWFLLVAGIVPIVFMVARTRIEEEKLIERFGDDYRHYMQTTGRFFPRFSQQKIASR